MSLEQDFKQKLFEKLSCPIYSEICRLGMIYVEQGEDYIQALDHHNGKRVKVTVKIEVN